MDQKHTLMQGVQADQSDCFIHIRSLIVDFLMKAEGDSLYPKSIGSLARTNRAWAQAVRDHTNTLFTDEDKKQIKKYRPLLKNSSLLLNIRQLESDVDMKLSKSHSKINCKLLYRLIHESDIKNKRVIDFICRRLLDKRARMDINRRYKKEYFLLGAIERGLLPVVELLVNAGADKKIKDKWGAGLLHLAAQSGNTEIAQLCIGLVSSSMKKLTLLLIMKLIVMSHHFTLQLRMAVQKWYSGY